MDSTFTQLSLFGDEHRKTAKKVKPKGGSGNPIVFRDYESFVAKFSDVAKTTDDCYTPKDVYEAVVKYVGTVCDLSERVILRPFYPGGDYENAEYPEDGVVIDNPPFSMFTKIVRFYCESGIPFFLFGPGLTIGSVFKYCTAVITSEQIRFDNGATVRINFASNLYGDTMITTAPLLDRLIKACPSQNVKANLPKYAYPAELVSVSDIQTIANGGLDFSISRDQCVIVRDIDNHPKGLFGDHLLTTTDIAAAKEAAKEAAKRIIHVPLSERERRVVEALQNGNGGGWANS